MADNLTVLNSTGGTFTLRQKDVGGGILANMSLPTDTAGNPMLVLSGSAVTSTMSAAVVAISSLSAPHVIVLSSAVTVTSSLLVVISSASNQTITSLTSGTVAISNGANTAAVKASVTTASTTDPSLVVQESPNSQLSVTTGTTADGAYAGSGSATINSILKGVYANITAAIPAGTNFIGYVTATPASSGGWSKWSTIKNNSSSPLTGTVVQVKTGAATFGGYFIYNANSTPTTLAVFDSSAAGAVTLGSNRPDLVFEVPATTGANIEFVNGINMANGIQVAATGTVASSSGPSSGLDATILFK